MNLQDLYDQNVARQKKRPQTKALGRDQVIA